DVAAALPRAGHLGYWDQVARAPASRWLDPSRRAGHPEGRGGQKGEDKMQVIITAVGPDNRGLADPIVHHVTSAGANIAEIQMYDHDAERVFAMLLRMDWPAEQEPVAQLRERMNAIGRDKSLSIRTWARDEHDRVPRLALCVTHRSEPPLAVLRAIRDG